MINKLLKQIRTAKELSQEQMAEILGVSRPTYADIEKGVGEVTLSALGRVAKELGVSLGSLVVGEDFQTEQEINKALQKYKSMLLYLLHCGADAKDGKITKTKLAKLLYLADFAWFYENLKPMSGLAYRRLAYGPVPDQYFRAIDELTDSKQIAITTSSKGALMIAAVEDTAPTYGLSKQEMALMQAICRKWKDRNTTDIVNFTHDQLPWKLCRENEVIPYELIIQEDPEHVY